MKRYKLIIKINKDPLSVPSKEMKWFLHFRHQDKSIEKDHDKNELPNGTII